ncbi:MAG: GNAT family N-acetyltransferase [Acidobacteriota bacterium]|nr:GNAT family N-acetyltransferase [Acidobacteriota bacterium]
MTEEVSLSESLTNVEKQQMFGWGDDIFGVASLNLRWRPKELHLLLHARGKAVSHVGLLKHTISVEERAVTVGGVGGVVTLPEMQKRGYAWLLMRHAAKLFCEWKVDAGLLFCLQRMIPFYESLGWEIVGHSVVIEQPSGKIALPLKVMVLSSNGSGWPSASS